MTKAEQFFNDIKDKKVAFIGVGVSHNDLIKLFLNKGIKVIVCDKKSGTDFDQSIYNELSELGVEFSLGENYLESIYEVDVIFRTPGMYFDNPALIEARRRGIVVTSEMEVFFELCPCKIFAVTGSDGKTTTTSLISEILSTEGFTVHKGGNIGRALLPIVETISEKDVAVVELSSFQLMSMRKSPDTAVITNISPNHLDVHGTMEEYVECKTNLIRHQGAFSRTVLNADNEGTIELSDLVRGDLVLFSRRKKVERGCFLNEDGIICYSMDGSVIEIMHKNEIKIPGIHNVENYLAAISAVWGIVSIKTIVKIAKEFGGVEHRIEFVREIGGVRWYNDSIATSPTRVLAGLNSFNQKLIVIAGGYDKKIPFEPLARPINENVKALILLGDTADKIQKAVTEYDDYNKDDLKIVRASTLDEAVSVAKELATDGDIVTLSPACASFDMYPNFEARGKHFKRLVNEL